MKCGLPVVPLSIVLHFAIRVAGNIPLSIIRIKEMRKTAIRQVLKIVENSNFLNVDVTNYDPSGFSSPSIVGMSSVTVGWICMAR